MKLLPFFRLISALEGVSLLFLFGIAMPLKYVFDDPSWIRVTGMTHALLFLLYVALLFQVYQSKGWAWTRLLSFFIASLVPFGFLWVEKNLREEK